MPQELLFRYLFLGDNSWGINGPVEYLCQFVNSYICIFAHNHVILSKHSSKNEITDLPILLFKVIKPSLKNIFLKESLLDF